MDKVALRDEVYVIERGGQEMVAVIGLKKYRDFLDEKKRAQKSLEEIWSKMKSEDPEELESSIGEAVLEVRREN